MHKSEKERRIRNTVHRIQTKQRAENGGIWEKGGSYDNEFKNGFGQRTGKQRQRISQYHGLRQTALAALSDLSDARIFTDVDFQVRAYERYSDRFSGLQSVQGRLRKRVGGI